MSITVFRRTEKKYLLTEEKYDKLMKCICRYLEDDKYARTLVCSTYLDTPSYLLIRNSIDADNYKEKIRLRTYGKTDAESHAFIEIKKKFNGVVYKRREEMSFSEAVAYIKGAPPPADTQIMREINYAMRFYNNPEPKIFLSYEREAYRCPSEEALRITFDRNILYRNDSPLADRGAYGKPILKSGEVLMEIKSGGSMPLWLSSILNQEKIYPSKFSKCAHAYMDILSRENKGVTING